MGADEISTGLGAVVVVSTSTEEATDTIFTLNKIAYNILYLGMNGPVGIQSRAKQRPERESGTIGKEKANVSSHKYKARKEVVWEVGR